MEIRRVVAGFDRNGKAEISSDGVVPHAELSKGLRVCALWAYGDKISFNSPNIVERGYTAGFDSDDTRMNWGVIALEQGGVLPMHSTQTVDLITVLEGELTCLLDSAAVIILKPHEILLLRGPVHQWENRGAARCAWSYVSLGRLDS